MNNMILPNCLFTLLYVFHFYIPRLTAVCVNNNDCHYFSWQSWTVCSGGNSCSRFISKRIRLFCCPNSVTNQTIDNCLNHCNVSDPWEDYKVKNSSCQTHSLKLQQGLCKGMILICNRCIYDIVWFRGSTVIVMCDFSVQINLNSLYVYLTYTVTLSLPSV